CLRSNRAGVGDQWILVRFVEGAGRDPEPLNTVGPKSTQTSLFPVVHRPRPVRMSKEGSNSTTFFSIKPLSHLRTSVCGTDWPDFVSIMPRLPCSYSSKDTHFQSFLSLAARLFIFSTPICSS